MTIAGRAIVLRGHDIDTDRIMPARYLKAISFEGLEAHLFADDRVEARARGLTHPFETADHDAAVLVVNGNFGCGSSREHAPQAIRRRGIRAVIGESFAEIFFTNAVAIGLPCVTAAPGDVERIMALAGPQGVEVAVDLSTMRARAGELDVPVAMPDSARHGLLTGEWDATGLLLRDYEDVERRAASLPYVSGFAPKAHHEGREDL